MKNQSSLLRWMGVFASVLIAFFALGQPAQSAAKATGAPANPRVDLVTLGSGEKGREMPVVKFKHDQHTQALAKEGKNCQACHQTKTVNGKEQVIFSFKETENLAASARKEAFHASCIGCHKELAAAGKPTGPTEASCRSCHNGESGLISSKESMRFDAMLHNRHIAAKTLQVAGAKDNCGTCHHTGFDAATGAFTVKRGTEEACLTCHIPPAQKAHELAKNPEAADAFGPIAKRTPSNQASHAMCINCHLQVTAQNAAASSGPVECAGCHDTKITQHYAPAEADIKTLASMRLDRGQPDAVLMFPAAAKKEDKQGGMLPVSFDHKLHEAAATDCRTCHHKKIAACSSCHTLEGKAEGGFVTLDKAMHSQTATRSCIGCHNQVTQQPQCAGCHASLPKRMNENACGTCHTAPVGLSNEKATPAALAALEKEERSRLAAATIQARNSRTVPAVAKSDIPETVTIGILSNEFEPSVLPHGKIVQTLTAKAAESKLANAFHTESTTLCQSCHHNSPASKTPPRCVSCHAVDPQKATSGVPALKAAYHLQCMTCHARMNQKPAETDCNGCHKPRVK